MSEVELDYRAWLEVHLVAGAPPSEAGIDFAHFDDALVICAEAQGGFDLDQLQMQFAVVDLRSFEIASVAVRVAGQREDFVAIRSRPFVVDVQAVACTVDTTLFLEDERHHHDCFGRSLTLEQRLEPTAANVDVVVHHDGECGAHIRQCPVASLGL